MKIGKLEKKLNKWQFGIEIGRRRELKNFWPLIRIWGLSLKHIPSVGEEVERCYRGFYWSFFPPIPIITFKTLRIGNKFFSIPIKIQLRVK